MKTEPFEPEIIAFCCEYCSYAAADLAGSMRLAYPPNVKIVKVPCTGRFDIIHGLKALEAGADGVFAFGCLEGNCHFEQGNLRARKRMKYLSGLLDECGIGGGRVGMYNMSSAMGRQFADAASEVTEKVRALGPNPAKRRPPKAKGTPHSSLCAGERADKGNGRRPIEVNEKWKR